MQICFIFYVILKVAAVFFFLSVNMKEDSSSYCELWIIEAEQAKHRSQFGQAAESFGGRSYELVIWGGLSSCIGL